jgi:hypothetical protein
MRGQLRLVVSNTTPTDRIIASIRPLGGKVAPSPGFRRQTRLRLLQLQPVDQEARVA